MKHRLRVKHFEQKKNQMLDYDKAIKSGSKLRHYIDKELLLPWIITFCLVLYEAFFFLLFDRFEA